MTEEQKQFLERAEKSKHYALEQARIARQLELHVIAAFWRDVAETLDTGIDSQRRAFRPEALQFVAFENGE